jgi:hypothetical protein
MPQETQQAHSALLIGVNLLHLRPVIVFGFLVFAKCNYWPQINADKNKILWLY